MKYPHVSHTHEKLARTFSSVAVTEKVADLMIARDRAIRELYLNYGLAETQKITGWTRPTIMMAVRKASSRQ